MPVHGLEQLPLPIKPPDPNGNVAIVRRDIPVLLACNHLEDDHPKCKDVSLACGPLAHCIFRRYVAPGAGDSGDGAPVPSHRAGDTEVAETSTQVGVEHNVAGLDVTVHYHWFMLMVNIVQAGGYICPSECCSGCAIVEY